ncbi:acetate/propionate family kinase [Streptomyces longispororuber]|uniref:acetate/propionate family kinase n=1 Tax=Streptomyces longispororuber TaxID=68230 RepID=UPI00210C0F51|nr:acetate/propionate family kinase [Streptomyces longispororuber]MCQ4205551.1 acetate/propionate family kinase [Streptomyces longispororuber]
MRTRISPVLVTDAGSSSLRLTVFGEGGEVLNEHHSDSPPGEAAFDSLWQLLREGPAPTAVGHRIAHGGLEMRSHTLLDDDVRARLDRVADLAPLHVPQALTVLDAARDLLPDVPHVVCFDTVFHSGLPACAREYAVPARWREAYGLRRYGFHGLSYAWALARTAELLGRRPVQLQLVMVHLGGGCSACAVREGHSVDTTMGFTPLEGLVMSRRSGSVDPGALTWLLKRKNVSVDEIEDALNHKSGLLALSGTSDDTRDLVRSRAAGDERAALALDVFTHHCRRGIAGMAASLSRLDALVFTGEIGEDQPEVREEVCARLSVLGLTGGLRPVIAERPEIVSAPDARIPVVVVPTGEAQQIDLETRALSIPPPTQLL